MKYIIVLFFLFATVKSQEIKYLEVKPEPGDGIAILFKRYEIPYINHLLQQFITLNKSRLTKKNHLILTQKYFLPIHIKRFDCKTIRSSINNNDYNYAKAIEEYNDRLFKKGIKPNVILEKI